MQPALAFFFYFSLKLQACIDLHSPVIWKGRLQQKYGGTNTNMGKLLSDWSPSWFVMLYAAWHTFALSHLHKCVSIIIDITLMHCNYCANESVFMQTVWSLSCCSVCLQLRWLLWIRTQRGIIWFIWWVCGSASSNVSCVCYQEINFLLPFSALVVMQ